MEPYAKEEDNRLAVILAYSLAMLFLAALLVKVDATGDSTNDQDVFSGLLIAVLFAGPFSIVARNVYDLAEDQPDESNKYDVDGNLQPPTHFRTWFKRATAAVFIVVGLFLPCFSAVWGKIKAILGPCRDTISSKFEAAWSIGVVSFKQSIVSSAIEAKNTVISACVFCASIPGAIKALVIHPKEVKVKTVRELRKEKRESLRKEKEDQEAKRAREEKRAVKAAEREAKKLARKISSSRIEAI